MKWGEMRGDSDFGQRAMRCSLNRDERSSQLIDLVSVHKRQSVTTNPHAFDSAFCSLNLPIFIPY